MWQREKQEAGMGTRLGSWLGRLEGRGEGSPKCLNNLVELSKCEFCTLIEHWPVGSVHCTPHKWRKQRGAEKNSCSIELELIKIELGNRKAHFVKNTKGVIS